MKSSPCPTYEDALRDYLMKFGSLMESPQAPESFVERAAEIADSSTGLFRLAQTYLDSTDSNIRETIRFHFIVQATAELLLGIEILRVSGEKNGSPSTAAMKATQSAALSEAVSAVEKAGPIAQGIHTGTSLRASESATITEAMSELKLVLEGTATNVCHRVEELGNDIVYDLITGNQWEDVIRGASFSEMEIGNILNLIHEGASATLMNSYRKISALLGREIAAEARLRVREWLEQIRPSDPGESFHDFAERLYCLGAFKSSVGFTDGSDATIDAVNRTADLIKALFDRFTVLVGYMRKMEDAIRLGKAIDLPQFRPATIAMQTALLASLLYTGKRYIENIVDTPPFLSTTLER